MRFNRIAIRGLGPFREAELDLSKIDGRVIAVTGANGSGKTTLLELLGGSLFRKTATRGSIADLATARDSFVEVDVVNGASHRIRHAIDAVSAKGESLVTDDAGKPRFGDTKVTSFDRWAALHLPTEEVFYSSVFAAQGSHGFLDLSTGDRKAVLLRVLGIERLERLAESAREHARHEKHTLALATARLDDERRRGGDVSALEAALVTLEAEALGTEARLAGARDDLERLLVANKDAAAIARARAEVLAKRAALEASLATVTAAIGDLAERIANNRKIQADGERIRAAVARLAGVRADVLAQECVLVEARESLASCLAERGKLETDLLVTEKAARDAGASRARAEARSATLPVARDADAALPAAKAAMLEAKDRFEAEHANLNALRDALVEGKSRRCASLRGHLEDVVRDEPNARVIAEGGLRADDAAIVDQETAPQRIAESQVRLATLEREHDARVKSCTVLVHAAGRLPDLEAAAAEAAQLAAEEARHAAELARLVPALAEAQQVHEGMLAVVAEHKAALEALRSDEKTLESTAALVGKLEGAEARLAELLPQEAARLEEEKTIRATLAELPPPPDAPPGVEEEIARLRESIARIEQDLASSRTRATESRTRLEAARVANERANAFAAEKKTVEETLADWTRLGEELGRDGLQAMEIDAAGPELTELVNDLLRTCVGPRWKVSIEASRPSADGKKLVEGCEVRVIDSERGREGTSESLSGGERVLVGEAVSLALAMLACRRSGAVSPTLIRDETGAALDPENGRRYIVMLRRAADIVGAHRVLFVTHVAELAEMADARIVVAGGKVTVTA